MNLVYCMNDHVVLSSSIEFLTEFLVVCMISSPLELSSVHSQNPGNVEKFLMSSHFTS